MSIQRYNNKSSRKERHVHMKRALVQMLDGNDIEFHLEGNCKGGALFNAVCTHLDLMERCYFGISYKDQKRNMYWLMYDIKITKQMRRNPWNFELHVKFYPPNPNLLQEEITRYYLCLQLRQDLYTGRLPCSFGVYILLGAYVVQSELGDFDPNNHSDIEYVRKIKFATKNAQNDELLSKISDLHKAMRGLTPEEADSSFLLNAKKMGLYGIEMHKVMNSREDETFLIGVYYDGIVVHKGFLRINRIIWPRILKFSYKKNIFKLIYNNRDLRTDIIKYRCSSEKFAKKLWLSCAECHSFFRMREIEVLKKKSIFKNTPRINVGITLYQTQRTIFERTPPQFKRHPVTEAMISSFEIEFPCNTASLQIINETFDGKENNEKRPSMYSSCIHFSFVDKSKNIRYNLNDNLTVYTCKNLDDNDHEWFGCRTNWGIRKMKEDELFQLIYFEMYVVSQGIAKIGWSTNNWDFNLTDEYGSIGDNNISLRSSRVHNMFSCPFGPVLNTDEVIGCYLDILSLKLWWKKNNDEVSDKIAIPDKFFQTGLYPTISLKSGVYKFNFGKELFKYHDEIEKIVGLESIPKKVLVDNAHHEWSLQHIHNANNENLTFFKNGEVVQSRLNVSWQGIRANHGLKLHAGCYYFEVTQLESRVDSLAMIGWTLGENSSLELGSHKMSWGYGADREGFGLNGNQGKKMHNDDIENYGKAFSKDDVIGCFLNLNDYSLSWSLNGIWFEVAYKIEPSSIILSEFVIFPTFYLKNNTIEVNFGYKKFKFNNTLNNIQYIPISQAPLNSLRQSEDKTNKFKQQGFSYASPGDILNIKLKSTNVVSDEPLFDSEPSKESLVDESDSILNINIDDDKVDLETTENKNITESEIIDYKKIPTILTKAIRFATHTDSIVEEYDSMCNPLQNIVLDYEIENKDKFPIVLTKTSYFRYGENNHSEMDQAIISNNSTVEICPLIGQESVEKRINELTSSIHRRSSGAEGGDIREVTLFKSKTKDRTQAAVIRHIVIDTDFNNYGQDLKQ